MWNDVMQQEQYVLTTVMDKTLTPSPRVFNLSLSGGSPCTRVYTQNIAFNTNILLGWRQIHITNQSRVLENPWKVLEFFAWKGVWTHLLFMHTITFHVQLPIEVIYENFNSDFILLTITRKSVHLWRDIVNRYFLSDRNIQTVTSSIVQN